MVEVDDSFPGKELHFIQNEPSYSYNLPVAIDFSHVTKLVRGTGDFLFLFNHYVNNFIGAVQTHEVTKERNGDRTLVLVVATIN